MRERESEITRPNKVRVVTSETNYCDGRSAINHAAMQSALAIYSQAQHESTPLGTRRRPPSDSDSMETWAAKLNYYQPAAGLIEH